MVRSAHFSDVYRSKWRDLRSPVGQVTQFTGYDSDAARCHPSIRIGVFVKVDTISSLSDIEIHDASTPAIYSGLPTAPVLDRYLSDVNSGKDRGSDSDIEVYAGMLVPDGSRAFKFRISATSSTHRRITARNESALCRAVRGRLMIRATSPRAQR